MSLNPPRPKGPPLNALRAFESAGRLRSFTAAADELSVTPGAISQHVKSLEAWAGGALFERKAKGVVLTPLGAALLPEFTDAFDRLSAAVQALRSKSAPHRISIATLPSIAQMWLSRKLGGLRQLAPEIRASVTAVETPPNLDREPFDVSIFFHDGPLRPEQIVLLQDRIFPVCAPELAAKLTGAEDLGQQTLLHDSTWAQDWQTWLRHIGLPAPTELGPSYSLFSVAVEEASNGAGVLIAHEALIEAKLTDGSLAAPLGPRLSLDRHLVMEVTDSFRGTPDFETFLRAVA